MLEKIGLTEKENEYLAKGIACGSGLGIFSGAIFGDVGMGLAAGGVIGILVSLIVSLYRRKK